MLFPRILKNNQVSWEGPGTPGVCHCLRIISPHITHRAQEEETTWCSSPRPRQGNGAEAQASWKLRPIIPCLEELASGRRKVVAPGDSPRQARGIDPEKASCTRQALPPAWVHSDPPHPTLLDKGPHIIESLQDTDK